MIHITWVGALLLALYLVLFVGCGLALFFAIDKAVDRYKAKRRKP